MVKPKERDVTLYAGHPRAVGESVYAHAADTQAAITERRMAIVT